MTLSFLIVLGILTKFGFPIITKAVQKRSEYIADSMETARLAEEKIAALQKEGDAILAKAQEERNALLNEAQEIRNRMIAEARGAAEAEARAVAEKARADIEESKRKALSEIRGQVADLSVRIASKVVRERLADEGAQKHLIDRLLDDEINYPS